MMVKKKTSWSQIVKNGRPANTSVTTRNLRPQDLGAVIFGCTNNTIAECHSRQLFGTFLSFLIQTLCIRYLFAKLSHIKLTHSFLPVSKINISTFQRIATCQVIHQLSSYICAMFQACQEHISPMYKISRKAYLCSCSITMTANYMVFMKLRAMASSVLNQMHGHKMARERPAILLRYNP